MNCFGQATGVHILEGFGFEARRFMNRTTAA